MSETKTTAKHYEFKAEVKQLLDILVHSLYSSKEIFLRELISNASDALDKLRFESIRGTEIEDNDLPLEIKITFDEKANTLTIKDTGIGMTEQELIDNIGTIAKSGTAQFLEQLKESKADASNIIGKFGVGFYSVFMVAKEVVIKTKSYKKDSVAFMWKSDGLGSYEINPLDEKISRGTELLIYLKEDAKDYTQKWQIESTIKKHSNFISFPIYVENERINNLSAIWREPKSSVTKEQYTEFYKHLSYDSEEPADIMHNSVDAPIQFFSLLFIPKKNMDFFGFQKDNYGLDLYVRRVLIQHKTKELLPEYLSFVKGVVDSEDLPLNIARESLQENIIFTKIANNITGQILTYLTKKAKDDPAAYLEFFKEHGRIFKLGYGDYQNQEKFMNLLRFNSSICSKEEDLISLEDYIGRMKSDQKEIYFALGPSRSALESDPHTEVFKRKGVEVLYFYDPLDEFVVSSLHKYKDYEFKSVEAADLGKIEKLDDIIKDKPEVEKLSKDDEKQFDSLISKIKEILGDKVTEVKESKRLTDSPACLVSPDDGMSSSMQKIMRQFNKDNSIQKKIFEVNKDHKIIRNLLAIFKVNSNDIYITNTVEQLFEASMLLDGSLTDPHNLINKMNKLMEENSDSYSRSVFK
ncbi:MAG TPA: molecular chaperone HtpG [Melioribacteraceae bacterium]|nr:molecular chaperone HtpG [Melioribacteraceae bacterium]